MPTTTLNLGVGRGYSVLEVVSAFEAACGRRIARRMQVTRSDDRFVKELKRTVAASAG